MLEFTTKTSEETIELGFKIGQKLKKGNIERLDSFLMELYSVKAFSKEEISNYIDKKQSIYDLAIKINKNLSIYVEVIDAEINTYITKWISYGFEEQTLLLIASRCFSTGKNTLQDMNDLLEFLNSLLFQMFRGRRI